MTLNDNKNKKINDDWDSGLLIKDETGKIHKLHQNLEKKVEVKKKVDHSINTSPNNDSFDYTPSLDGSANSKADFSFHPEDKFQLDKISKELPNDDSKKYSLDKIIDKLIEKNKLKLDKSNKKIFSNIIFDFFRNRKTVIVLRDILSNNVLINKNKIKKDIVDNLVLVIKGIKNKIDGTGGLVIKMNIKVPKKEIKDKVVKEKKVIKPIVEESSVDIIKKEINNKEKIKKPIIKKKEVSKVKEEIKNSEINLPKVSRPKKSSLDKGNVVGVITKIKKQEPESVKTLSGPIDELQNLSLDNFRRLGDNAKDMADKVAYKINLLEEESFTKKAEGIKAWKSNVIYKLYLQIGNDSLENDKEIKEIIKDYKKAGKDVLTFEEFSAISDLNKLLRF